MVVVVVVVAGCCCLADAFAITAMIGVYFLYFFGQVRIGKRVVSVFVLEFSFLFDQRTLIELVFCLSHSHTLPNTLSLSLTHKHRLRTGFRVFFYFLIIAFFFCYAPVIICTLSHATLSSLNLNIEPQISQAIFVFGPELQQTSWLKGPWYW